MPKSSAEVNTMAKKNKKSRWIDRMNGWLSDEQGALEREMEAAQEQAAAPDVEQLSPAELRWSGRSSAAP